MYLRVSKSDGQTVENQRPEVEALAAGFEVVEVFEDRQSAFKRRPQFEAMLHGFRRRQYGSSPHLVLWSLDRLGRGLGCLDLFRELVGLGVRVHSVREPWTATDGPALELLVAVMSWVSGFERQRLVERTRAGLERARRSGRRLGRPRVVLPLEELRRACDQWAEGKSVRTIASGLKTKIGDSTLHRLLQAQSQIQAATAHPANGLAIMGVQPS